MVTTTLDLQPLVDADASFSQDDYPPAFLAPFQDGSALHGLPYTIYFDVLNYNQTAFEAAGLGPPQIDWTMDDLLAAVEQLDTGQSEDRQYGFAIIGSQASEALFLLERLGVSLTTQDAGEFHQPNFTDPEVIEGVKFLVDLIANYTPHTELQGYTRQSYGDDSYQLINEGRVGMWMGGGFGFANTGESEFTTAIAPKPLGESPISPNDFFATGLFISAQTEQQDSCWHWLKHLSTEMVDTYSSNFPARRSVLESESFAEQASPGTVEVYEAYSDALERTPNDNNTVGRPIEFYWFFQALDRAVQGEDLEQALTNAQVTTEDYLACAQQNDNDRDGSCLIQVDPDYEGTRVLSTPVPEDDP